MDYDQKIHGPQLDWIKEKYEGKPVTGSRSEAGNWLQLTLEHIEKGTAVISLEVRPEMTNPYGMIHGGMMSLVIDEAIGWAIVSLSAENHYTSLNLNVDFLYAVPKNTRITAKATIIRQGKKIVHAECEVHDAHGRLAGKASSNLIVTGMKLKD
ncbi:PaaI family thioesterase [Chitinophagaceae bacterium MMS25-I14]